MKVRLGSPWMTGSLVLLLLALASALAERAARPEPFDAPSGAPSGAAAQPPMDPQQSTGCPASTLPDQGVCVPVPVQTAQALGSPPTATSEPVDAAPR